MLLLLLIFVDDCYNQYLKNNIERLLPFDLDEVVSKLVGKIKITGSEVIAEEQSLFEYMYCKFVSSLFFRTKYVHREMEGYKSAKSSDEHANAMVRNVRLYIYLFSLFKTFKIIKFSGVYPYN